MSGNWLSHKEIGERVKALRAELGVTQTKLAEMIGRPGDQSEISKVERGKKWTGGQRPDANYLLAIARAGGRDLSYFQAASDVVDPSIQERLIVARWMEDIAKQLRREVAEATSQPVANDEGLALDEMAEEVERRKRDRRQGNDGPPSSGERRRGGGRRAGGQ